jgi:hypothetical protein
MPARTKKSDVKQPDERDKVLSGKATFDELTRWLDKWEDLYGRWRGSLEQRFEEEAVARSRSYESGRFGPDDYDVLLGRLRTSVLQRAKQIGDVVKLFEDSGPLAVGALPPPPGVAAGQTSATDKLSQCISEVYRGAAKELKEMQARKELGLLVFPIANQSDPVEKDTEKLKNFREAFLLGVMESGEFIEKHPFHEIYRDRIRTLLILRRDLLQLGDISRCKRIAAQREPGGDRRGANGGSAAARARPADTVRCRSGAGGRRLPQRSSPPPLRRRRPPPCRCHRRPLPPGAAGRRSRAGPAGRRAAAAGDPAPDQPAAGLPLPAAPAPVQPGALATAPPTPGSVVVQPTAGPQPAAGTPPPGVAQTLVQAQPTGLVRTNAQQAQVPFIDATQLQRRLLDSEFWPRIYKAATGVDDPMDNIDDLMPAGGIALVTPPSLKSLARVTWDPQRKRRAFQVSERVEALRVASQRECLVAMTLDAPEALTVEVEGGKTQTLFVSPPVSKRLKEEAPNLKLEILLRYASTQLAERTKQQALLSRVQRVNPCDFQIVPIDVPVGLFNFAVRLSEAREIYTYAISPTEPDELIANRMRADMMREFGMQAAMKNLAQSGVDAGARLKAEEEMSKFARFDTVQRSVFGYGEKGEQARVGWQILPRDQLPAGGGSDRLYLAPRQIPMTALLSLPAWWDKIRLTVRRSWVDRRGREHEISPSAPPYVIDLPTNFETLDASLLRNADTTGPVLVDWQMPRMAIRPCQPFFGDPDRPPPVAQHGGHPGRRAGRPGGGDAQHERHHRQLRAGTASRKSSRQAAARQGRQGAALLCAAHGLDEPGQREPAAADQVRAPRGGGVTRSGVQGRRAGRQGVAGLEHIPFGWNQPNGMCPVKQHRPRAHFRADGTARGSICSEIALGPVRAGRSGPLRRSRCRACRPPPCP